MSGAPGGGESAVDQTQQVHEAVPFSAFLGVRDVAGTAEEVRARLDWSADRCTDSGSLHGGALMGVADVVGGIVAFLNLPPGAVGTTTIESKTNFFGPLRSGFVEAVGRPIHVGRTTVVIDTDLFDERGTRLARITQTQAVLQPRG